MEEEIQEEISAAVKKTESFEPDILEPFQHCYAEMTPELKRQMQHFKDYLNGSAPGGIGVKGSHELSPNMH
jgi:pyruvate dehydrogenase E1 component alpha subunit